MAWRKKAEMSKIEKKGKERKREESQKGEVISDRHVLILNQTIQS